MRVSVFGLGYVGCVTAACLAAEGNDVYGVDVSEAKVDLLRNGKSPIVEDGLPQLLAAAVEAGRLRAGTDASHAVLNTEVSIICVGTPSRSNGSLDLTYVERVLQDVGASMAGKSDFHLVQLRSTVLPGTMESFVIPLLERASGKRVGHDFGVAFCPEFLREGSAISDFYDPPFTVCGTRDPESEKIVQELFGFIRAPFHAVDLGVAEALKYACNAYHAVKITFANEMARFCAASSVDPRPVMDLFCQDDLLNISARYLRPGFSFGGSCLPKDVRALIHQARSADTDLPLLNSLLTSNEQHTARAVDWVLDGQPKRVALLGLAFKEGTDDLRESPFVEVAERLIGKGVEVAIYDPVVNPAGLVGANRVHMEQRLPHLARILHQRPADALDGADCVVLGTSDAEVVEALAAAGSPRTLDVTGRLSAAQAARLENCEGLAW